MEEAFGQFTSQVETAADLEQLYFELSDHLQFYLKEEEKSFIPSDQLRNKFQGDFISPGKFLGATDRGRYKEFVNRMTKGMDISVMSFNYIIQIHWNVCWRLVMGKIRIMVMVAICAK